MPPDAERGILRKKINPDTLEYGGRRLQLQGLLIHVPDDSSPSKSDGPDFMSARGERSVTFSTDPTLLYVGKRGSLLARSNQFPIHAPPAVPTQWKRLS